MIELISENILSLLFSVSLLCIDVASDLDDTTWSEERWIEATKEADQYLNKRPDEYNALDYEVYENTQDLKANEFKNITEGFSQLKPIDASTLLKIVVNELPEINSFEEAVEITDTVLEAANNDDTGSMSSDEVTFERWTEDSKIIQVYQDGALVGEIVQPSKPEITEDEIKRAIINKFELMEDLEEAQVAHKTSQSNEEFLTLTPLNLTAISPIRHYHDSLESSMQDENIFVKQIDNMFDTNINELKGNLVEEENFNEFFANSSKRPQVEAQVFQIINKEKENELITCSTQMIDSLTQDYEVIAIQTNTATNYDDFANISNISAVPTFNNNTFEKHTALENCENIEIHDIHLGKKEVEPFELLNRESDEETRPQNNLTNKSKLRLKKRLESLQYLSVDDNGDDLVGDQGVRDEPNERDKSPTPDQMQQLIDALMAESLDIPAEYANSVHFNEDIQSLNENVHIDSPHFSTVDFVEESESGYRSDTTRFSMKSALTESANFGMTATTTFKSTDFEEIYKETFRNETELLENESKLFGSRIKEMQSVIGQKSEETEQDVKAPTKFIITEKIETNESVAEEVREKSESETSESLESFERYKRPSPSEIKQNLIESQEKVEEETPSTSFKGIVKDYINKFERKTSESGEADLKTQKPIRKPFSKYEEYLNATEKASISSQPEERARSDRVKEIIEAFNSKDLSSINSVKTRDAIHGLSAEEIQRLKENKAFMKNLETILNQPEQESKYTSTSGNLKDLKNLLIEKLFPMQAIETTVISSDGESDSNFTPSTDIDHNRKEEVGDENAFNKKVAEQLRLKIDVTDVSDDDQMFETPITIDKQKPTREEIMNKRQLSEIKPIIKPSKGLNEAETREIKPIYKAGTFETKFPEPIRIMIETEESEDTDTSSDILKRNLAILKRKTSEKQHRSGSIMTEEAIDIDISQFEQKRIVPQIHSQRFNYSTAQKDDLNSIVQPPSFVSSHSLKNVKPLKPSGLPLSKIKVLKKSNDEISCSEEDALANELRKGDRTAILCNKKRQVSPTHLRAQDLIETIETTTTTMQYISSKTVDLIYEERKAPQTINDTNSHSRYSDDAYNSYIQHTQPQLTELNAVPVPIIMQTRSKSESVTDNRKKLYPTTRDDYYSYAPTPTAIKAQRLNQAEQYLSPPVASAKIHVAPIYDDSKMYSDKPYEYRSYESSSNSVSPNRGFPSYNQYDRCAQTNTQQANRPQNYINPTSGSDSGLATSFSTQHAGKNYEVHGSSPRSQVSFHKFDSNEIIAVVKVPAKGATDYQATDERKQWPKSKSEANLTNLRDQKYTNYQNGTDFNRIDFKLEQDHWKAWPEYTVDQEADSSSFIATNEIKDSVKPVWTKNVKETDTRNTSSLKKQPKPGSQSYSNVEFEIEVEKRPPNYNTIPSTTVSIDGQPSRAKVSTAKDGRVSIRNIVGIPGNEITIQSDVHNEDPKTRMSSGYFSGEEFHAGKHGSRAAQRKTQLENFNNFENNDINNQSTNFNVNKFIHKKNKQNWDAIEELDNLYKSLGLEDEALLDRANARDYKLYGNLKEQDSRNHGDEQYYENVNSVGPSERKSIYSRKSALPDAISDDMARRKNDENQNKYYPTEYSSHNVPLDNKRSNSINSLLFNQYPNDTLPNHLRILPSPTSADYLRNRTRENALYDVVVKNPPDTELSQILYDDMAYRQLRKDTDVVKPSLNKQNISFSSINLSTDRSKNKNASSYDQFDNFALKSDYSSYNNNNNFSNPVNNYLNNNGNSVKTVKMVKQKDATKGFKRDPSNVYLSTQQLGLGNK